jgi:hypothetical protein
MPMRINMIDGYYYLHTNGELIYKKFLPEPDSPFVKAVWSIDTNDRTDAWRIVLEALALNANIKSVKQLAIRWDLDFDDSIEMQKRIYYPSDLMMKGFPIFVGTILGMTEYDYWENANRYNMQQRGFSS